MAERDSVFRIVADTNIVISGLIWDGAPARLIDAGIEGKVTLITSILLLAELRDVLHRPKFAKPLFARGVDADMLFDGYAALAHCIEPATIEPVILRDPDDDAVIATAIAAQADMIASGDDDLLILGRFRDIPILRIADVLERVGL
jgi:uncharacterized protein